MAEPKREHWSKLIAEQEASGKTIRAFCKERGIAEQSVYSWRKRLRKTESVQFAVLNPVASAVPLELYLANGERLRIGRGVDAATLRLVLEVVRE
jgi:hypothetical protein